MYSNIRKRILAFGMLCVLLGTTVMWENFFYSQGATASIVVKYGGKRHTFSKKKQTSAKVNGKKVNTKIPGLIVNNTNLVSSTVVKQKTLGITYKYNKKTKVVTLKRKNTVVKITMGSKYARVNGKKVEMGTKAQRMYYVAKKTYYNMLPARFIFETFGFEYKWKQSSRSCEITCKNVATPTPEITSTPKVTATPEITSIPKVTATPEITSTPKVTATPEVTSTPKITATPEITSTPKVTATPEVTSVPQVTTSPQITGAPNLTTNPAITEKPSGDVVSGASVEMKAMWISYLEYGSKAKTETQFTQMMEKMFDGCVNYGMNAVIVQVRPFSDAMYPSKYFPWSKYVSGKLGKDPGYDPLAIMVELAHARGLEFHAWLNPYRVTLGSTDEDSLPDNHPAKKWMLDEDENVQRNVLSYGGNLYYNPSSSKVRTLITNGVKEIVENYDVDGIHFDDYFYPQLGSSYKIVFDANEYNSYVDACSAGAIAPKSIVNWRRGNVNTLIKKVYKAVKDTKPDVVFGISPAGNIDNLLSSTAYYANVKTWMANDGYVDYICPQIYWSFENKTCPFEATTKRWASLKTNENVKLYIGLGVYRAGSSEEAEWSRCDDVLKRQVLCARNILQVSGFGFYRYESFTLKRCEKEINNLVPLLKMK